MTSTVVEVHGSRDEAYPWRPNAKVILDSISSNGDRLTTLQVEIHRYMLPEFNTHRKFSRNSASSRAIPYAKMRKKALETPVLPSSWRAEQKGMQGGEFLDEAHQDFATRKWLHARDQAVRAADELHTAGVHKSTINRLLEPFLPHTIIVSSTDYTGFFEQRCNPQAQDDIRIAAEAMREACYSSTPQPLRHGQWHTPYITKDDWTQASAEDLDMAQQRDLFKKISAARCARVSYLSQSGKREWDKDIDLYDRLVTSGHWSPFEHVATPERPGVQTPGNFDGWRQWRHELEFPRQ